MHRGCVARGGFSTCYMDDTLSACALQECLVGLTRSAAAVIICKRRSSRRILHVVALGSGFEERTTIHDASEKEGRNKDNNRLHCGWWYLLLFSSLTRTFSECSSSPSGRDFIRRCGGSWELCFSNQKPRKSYSATRNEVHWQSLCLAVSRTQVH